MNITCYSGFSKEINSTKRPSGGTGKSVVLKQPTSVLNPVFIIEGYNLAWNYIQWGARYYFVDDIVIVHNNIAEYHCSTDVLATYKNEIGSSVQYVLRSASDYNENIIDTFYPIEAVQTEIKTTSSQDPEWTRSVSSGQFVLGVMGKNSSPNGGAVTYYAISSSGMTAITNFLLSEANYSGVTEISADLLKCIFNPLEYIVSCMWFPFTVHSLSSTTINIGWWDITGVSAYKITDPVYTRNLAFSIPKHPQATSRGNYLNMSPFSRYVCNAGPWGIIPINDSYLIGEDSVSFQITVDLYTGSGRLSQVCSDVIAYNNDHVAQIGVPIQLGQNMLNQGAISGLLDAGTELTQGFLSGGQGHIFGGTRTAISSVLSLSHPINSSIGSNGTIAFNTSFALVGEFMLVVNDSVAKNGRPLCAPRTISTLSGFIQIHNPDVNISGSPSEKEAIVSFMENGFFYE